MKTLRLFLLLVGLAGSISHAHAADAVTVKGILRNWGLVFSGNFLGALTVAFMMSSIEVPA